MGRGWGGDGDWCDRDGVGMGRNLWGWGGYGENKSVVPVQQSSVNTYGCVFVWFFLFFFLWCLYQSSCCNVFLQCVTSSMSQLALLQLALLLLNCVHIAFCYVDIE